MRDGAGHDRWVELGKPLLPTLVVDGAVSSVQHDSQIASLLGIEVEGGQSAERIAWDTVTILDSWVANLHELSWEELVAPTLSRGRSTLNLTVNAFHPFELLPDAFDAQVFPWRPDLTDAVMEGELHTAEATVQFASRVAMGWQLFLHEREAPDAFEDRVVTSPRGELQLHALLESQRWHVAWHHRQVVDAAHRRGSELTSELSQEMVRAIGLPDYLY